MTLLFHEIYSKLHKGIKLHLCRVTLDIVNAEFGNYNFVFICLDEGGAKKAIIQKLIEAKISFVDVGIGIYVVNGLLTGSVRVTTGTQEKNDHIEKGISFENNDADNDYDNNIQITEINALNAALAVIKWKKLFGFYHDLEKEHHAVYEINANKILHNETVS